MNRAVAAFALVFTAAQRTVVRPIRMRAPDCGFALLPQRWPSTASVAVTLNDTRAYLPVARAVLATAPVSCRLCQVEVETGNIERAAPRVSSVDPCRPSMRGERSLPLPRHRHTVLSSPVTASVCVHRPGASRVRHDAVGATHADIDRSFDWNRSDAPPKGRPRTLPAGHPTGPASRKYAYVSSTGPRPRTRVVPVRVWRRAASCGAPAGQSVGGYFDVDQGVVRQRSRNPCGGQRFGIHRRRAPRKQPPAPAPYG